MPSWPALDRFCQTRPAPVPIFMDSVQDLRAGAVFPWLPELQRTQDSPESGKLIILSGQLEQPALLRAMSVLHVPYAAISSKAEVGEFESYICLPDAIIHGSFGVFVVFIRYF